MGKQALAGRFAHLSTLKKLFSLTWVTCLELPAYSSHHIQENASTVSRVRSF